MSNLELAQLHLDDVPEQPAFLPAEDPLEAIYGPTGVLSTWEEVRLVADEDRLDREFRSEHHWPRRSVVSLVDSSQLGLPDIFREPVPERFQQHRMFSDLEVRSKRPNSASDNKDRTTPTGLPMAPQDNPQDVVLGTEWMRDI